MTRRPRAARSTEPASVTWRDGVHLTGTPIWCDARRRRDVCFVSSAERVGKTGHGQLIGSPLTLALLGATGGGHLAVPLRRRFTLGTLRLELIDSARGPGATALYVDIAGRPILYAGAIRAGAEVRACDALVVSAPYGKPEHAFPPLAAVIEQTVAWTAAELAAGRRPVLLVETALDGLEVALELARAGIAIAASRPIREAAQRAGQAATTLHLADQPLLVAAPGKEPRAIVWLAHDRDGAARAARGAAFTVSRVVERGWVHGAGRRELLAWIESANAREVYVTGACAEDIASTLGPRARAIGPPQQMTLFEASS